MDQPASSPISDRNVDALLAGQNERILFPLAVAAVIFLAPFAINNFLKERYLLGVAVSVVVVGFAVDAWAMHRKKAAPIPYAILLAPVIAAMAISIRTQGIYGALWVYPSMLFFYSVLSQRMANWCSGALLALFTPLVYFYVEPGVALRFCVTLALTAVIVNIRVHQVREMQRKLLELSMTDPLTGAYNRRHMDACLRDVVERKHRSGACATLMIVDIDHFKRINDEIGHEAGDTVLKAFVKTVTERARAVDHLFRIGGEEFLLLLPDTALDGALMVAESMRAAIACASLLEQRPVTASIGVSELRAGQSVDAWMKHADAGLYLAKQSGRNRVVHAQ